MVFVPPVKPILVVAAAAEAMLVVAPPVLLIFVAPIASKIAEGVFVPTPTLVGRAVLPSTRLLLAPTIAFAPIAPAFDKSPTVLAFAPISVLLEPVIIALPVLTPTVVLEPPVDIFNVDNDPT